MITQGNQLAFQSNLSMVDDYCAIAKMLTKTEHLRHNANMRLLSMSKLHLQCHLILNWYWMLGRTCCCYFTSQRGQPETKHQMWTRTDFETPGPWAHTCQIPPPLFVYRRTPRLKETRCLFKVTFVTFCSCFVSLCGNCMSVCSFFVQFFVVLCLFLVDVCPFVVFSVFT